jgi:amino acid transporter
MAENKIKSGYDFGTFSGVFTPSILTIFGLIMFLRTSQVVGEAGIKGALLILIVAQSITLATGLSISAISTNTPVKGGGVYYLISRTLGNAFGGSIGITLFLAQALSIPFYILGFSESFIKAMNGFFPALNNQVLAVNLVTTAIIFFLAWIGAKWAIKAQFFILAVLLTSIGVFLFGAMQSFSMTTFQQNWQPSPNSHFSQLFALFFPAVTGVMAGVNMSGDLKDPQKSIPRGSLAAILVGALVYGLQMVITGGAFTRLELIQNPYMVLVSHALFGAGFLVVGGVFAATVSSAIGSFLGAPRVLQALSSDKVYKRLRFFEKGVGEQNEPRRALILSLGITLAIIFWAGRSLEGGGGINTVSSIVTMFFLYTYGMVNLAAFVESFGRNPSFRPRFKLYHWSLALYGAISCLIVSFIIDSQASAIALVTLGTLYYVARKGGMRQTFGDAQRGFIYSRIRNSLLLLSKMPMHPKNWRPTIAIITDSSQKNIPMIVLANLLEAKRGIVSLTEFIIGSRDTLYRTTPAVEQKRLEKWATEQDLGIFPQVLVTPDFDTGLFHFLQTTSIGPIKPNIIMQGWPQREELFTPFTDHLTTIAQLGMSSLIYVDFENRDFDEKRRDGFIDIWWRGKENGSLMILLGYLLQQNHNWKRTTIRLLRTVDNEQAIQPAKQALEEIGEAARVEIETKVILSKQFNQTLHEVSSSSHLVLMGFRLPKREEAQAIYQNIERNLTGLPPILFVNSSGDADFLA